GDSVCDEFPGRPLFRFKSDSEGLHHHCARRNRQPARLIAGWHSARLGGGIHRVLLGSRMGPCAQHRASAGHPRGRAGWHRGLEARVKRHVLLIALALIALAPVPFLAGAYVTTFIFLLLVWFVLAQSWDWVGGEMGYINLGHFAFYGIGAY